MFNSNHLTDLFYEFSKPILSKILSYEKKKKENVFYVPHVELSSCWLYRNYQDTLYTCTYKKQESHFSSFLCV